MRSNHQSSPGYTLLLCAGIRKGDLTQASKLLRETKGTGGYKPWWFLWLWILTPAPKSWVAGVINAFPQVTWIMKSFNYFPLVFLCFPWVHRPFSANLIWLVDPSLLYFYLEGLTLHSELGTIGLSPLPLDHCLSGICICQFVSLCDKETVFLVFLLLHYNYLCVCVSRQLLPGSYLSGESSLAKILFLPKICMTTARWLSRLTKFENSLWYRR